MTYDHVNRGNRTNQPGWHCCEIEPYASFAPVMTLCTNTIHTVKHTHRCVCVYIYTYNIYLFMYVYICTRPCHPPHPPPWDGSHILPPYEIFPLPPVVWWGCGTVPLPPCPPCGVVGVWYCPPPPVVWWECGMVCWVWCVWSVWYDMFGKYGMFGMYGRYAMYGMNGCYCMDGKYGM